MPRVSKEPEERKEEIIEAARKLFEEKGYEETMMSDVAQSIGISQGLPYRYFKSKLELLDAVASKFGTEFLKVVLGLKFKQGTSAKERLDKYFDTVGSIAESRLVSILHKKDNSEVHRRISENIFKGLIPQLRELIEEGNRDGSFDCPYPDAAADFLIYGAMSIHEKVQMRGVPDTIKVIRQVFYRILGVEQD
ncbi:MAG TPA: TetR/AcrR family transcriptional regulator [Clostridia bacterium]|nr:TetR/AcrR family transcriptional regulator [Clostridia bacterium]